MIYYVERLGVYSQGIYGIFDTETQAIEAMNLAKKLEEDNYHDFVVKVRKVNELGYDKEKIITGRR